MNKPFVLVVEDDKPISKLITTTLDTQGYRHVAAATGESAVIKLTTRQPDIMILDLGLPDLDGVDIIRKVRTWSNLPIIVVSARMEDHDKIEALDAGADDYLTKPLLCLLAKNAGKVLTHNFILHQIWGNHPYDVPALRVFMATLRKKIESPGHPRQIQTHIGIGYRMIQLVEDE
jgi:DNA-binding response OmpR family regulator